MAVLRYETLERALSLADGGGARLWTTPSAPGPDARTGTRLATLDPGGAPFTGACFDCRPDQPRVNHPHARDRHDVDGPAVAGSRAPLPQMIEGSIESVTLAREDESGILAPARQPGDLDTVAAIGSAFHQLAQKNDFIIPFFNGDIKILDPGFGAGQFG